MPTTLKKGDLLIADPSLNDPNFDGTVVLLCAHSEEGSMGLVLNRHTHLTLDQAIAEPGELQGRAVPIQLGGPVGLDRLHVLHGGPDTTPDSETVVPGLQFGADYDSVARLYLAGTPVRFFLGYAGWDEGQLEGEMSEGVWRRAPADPAFLFETDTGLLWPRLMAEHDPEYRWMRHLPPDPWKD